jgi:hypothetical protein
MWLSSPHSLAHFCLVFSKTARFREKIYWAWRFTENNKIQVEATEMDALRRSSRISRKKELEI